jgi:hypothetical protein
MTDLIALGLRFEAESADAATDKMDRLTASAERVETATDGMASGSVRADSAMGEIAASADRAAARMAGYIQAHERATGAAMRHGDAVDGAGSASINYQARLDALRRSVDPIGVAQARVNSELMEARALYDAGALGAVEYAQAVAALDARLDTLNVAQMRAAGGARLTSAEALNLSRQFADVGVSAVMGMNPLMILAMQGPQIADIMKTSRLGFRDIGRQLLVSVGILQVVETETASAATSQVALNAAQRAGVGTASAVATANQGAAVAAGELAVANGAAATSARGAGGAMAGAGAAGGAASVGIGALGAVLIPLVAAAGLATGAFALFHREMARGYPDDITDGMQLTKEQLLEVESRTVSMGDTFMSVLDVVGGYIMDGPVGDAINWLGETWNGALDWMGENAVAFGAAQIDLMVGTVTTIGQVWSALPGAVGAAVSSAVNLTATAIEWVVERALAGINGLIDRVNTLPLVEIGRLSDSISLGRMNVGSFDDLSTVAGILADIPGAVRQNGDGAGRRFFDEIGERAVGRAQDRARDEAGAPDFDLEGGLDKGDRDGAGGRASRAAEQAARDYERLIEAGTRYRDGLIREREELGLNREERMMRAAQMEADRIATEGNTDASRALASQIMDEARALRDATWAQAARDEQRSQNDTLSMLELERDLIGASNAERAGQLAMLRTEIELRNRLGQAFVDSAAGQETIQGARRVAVYEEGNRDAQNAYNDGLTITLDRLRQVEDHANAAAQGLASAFGAPGEALGGMLSVMTRAQTRLEEINDAQRRYVREMGTAGVSAQRMAMFERERGQASIQSWGDMAAAARGFFDEGSTGYRVLMAIEQGYRLMQFAGAIQAMILGQQETASVVAGNVVKATSHGTVAVARSMASLPFPANMAAAAATVAALAALGVMLGGGGRGGGAGRDDVSRAEEATETLRHRFSKGGSGGGGGGTDPQGARVVVEFREGPAFGGKVVEAVGPVMAEVGQASAQGGSQLALSRAARRGRNRLGVR